jgi:hypothetical protein
MEELFLFREAFGVRTRPRVGFSLPLSYPNTWQPNDSPSPELRRLDTARRPQLVVEAALRTIGKFARTQLDQLCGKNKRQPLQTIPDSLPALSFV